MPRLEIKSMEGGAGRGCMKEESLLCGGAAWCPSARMCVVNKDAEK